MNMTAIYIFFYSTSPNYMGIGYIYKVESEVVLPVRQRLHDAHHYQSLPYPHSVLDVTPERNCLHFQQKIK